MMPVRMKSLRTLSALACVTLLAACVGTSHDTPAPADAPRPIGGDRDAHGCLAPAGYRWCERERACVRPWELAKEKGFDNTPAGYDAWCDAKDAPATP